MKPKDVLLAMLMDQCVYDEFEEFGLVVRVIEFESCCGVSHRISGFWDEESKGFVPRFYSQYDSKGDPIFRESVDWS